MTKDTSDGKHSVSPMLAIFTAIQFLTRVPVPGAMSGTLENYQAALRASLVYFPVVGVLIGIFTSATYAISVCFWSPLIAAILAVGAEAFLTGAFHEDALADATDALGGGWTREQVLEILKDSRHGTYGVMALVIGVTLRIALIANLSWPIACLAIPFSAGIGRWSILIFMNRLDPITDRHTMARDVGSKPTAKVVLLGSLGLMVSLGIVFGCFCALVTSESIYFLDVYFGTRLLIAVSMSLIMTWYYLRLVRRRVGGVTGDFLGANCYLVQLVSLLALQPLAV